jgi:DNA mismatch repair protein MutS
MLRQYFATKERYPGTLLAMRVGDFYEFYGEDAETAARDLQITLTSRDDGGQRMPMSGVPFHSVEKYLARLVSLGHKVALCDQVEDPKLAKGLVKREVTRVLTPGTIVEDGMLDAGANNFLASASVTEDSAGISFLDLSTGEFLVTEVAGEDVRERTLQEIARFDPAECLLPDEADELYALLSKLTRTMVTKVKFLRPTEAKGRLMKQFGTSTLSGFGVEEMEAGSAAAGTILSYLDSNEIESPHVERIQSYTLDSAMRLDPPTMRALELTQNMQDGKKAMSLLAVLDMTKTPMGARRLRRWVEAPLKDREQIEERLEAVEGFRSSHLNRDELRRLLGSLGDIERIVSRAGFGSAHGRDLIGLRDSLTQLPSLIESLLKSERGIALKLRKEIDPCEDLVSELVAALNNDQPQTTREGGMIRPGYDPELDELRKLSSEARTFIAGIEQKARDETGIDRLKVGYNSVFGYYLEVPKSQIAQVPENYIRKQTTANAERYITAELKDYESKVLGSQEKAYDIEYRLFSKLRARVTEHASRLIGTAAAIAQVDCLQSLAEAATVRRFVRPTLSEDDAKICIVGGRHPVVEMHAGFSAFTPNDLSLAPEVRTSIILTGPNMSGKSTYLRQTALIVLMAQIGSFVPAESADLPIVDRVFARIGARDELASGQSTFMVEMTEAAHILHHATPRSLVILDEIGRGTSTYDGLAIAWAIAEYLAQVGAMTLFATHYHQLNSLAESMPNVANYRVAVREENDRVIWLHKVLEGGTDRSYGIQVAQMAGVPRTVLDRASEVLADLEGKEAPIGRIRPAALQMTLFEAAPDPVRKTLEDLDTSTLTPVEALVLLDNLRRQAAKKG